MTQIGFYHLTRTGITEALPPLLTRTLDAGEKAVVWCAAKPMLQELDKALWQVSAPRWLPHGSEGALCPDLHPIWLTTGEDCPNQARFLFLLEDRTCPDFAAFSRVFDLFDGQNPQAVAAARERWSAARAAGHTPTYWKQEAQGWTRGG